ncbi:hypothetical protein WJX84_004279 [Apatococcus fuscideae]|uniref:Uncharacterized protein n=1 Tax=Apatococcus fuscideae TaxID=2026836 RepID=A0AAW1SX90_9CHLO
MLRSSCRLLAALRQQERSGTHRSLEALLSGTRPAQTLALPTNTEQTLLLPLKSLLDVIDAWTYGWAYGLHAWAAPQSGQGSPGSPEEKRNLELRSLMVHAGALSRAGELEAALAKYPAELDVAQRLVGDVDTHLLGTVRFLRQQIETAASISHASDCGDAPSSPAGLFDLQRSAEAAGPFPGSYLPFTPNTACQMASAMAKHNGPEGLLQAFNILDTEIEQKPLDIAPLRLRAHLHQEHGDVPAAERDLMAAQCLQPTHTGVARSTADLHRSAGHPELSVQELTTTQPGNCHALLDLARCLQNHGSLLESTAALRKAQSLALEPAFDADQRYRILQGVADTYAAGGNTTEAQRILCSLSLGESQDPFGPARAAKGTCNNIRQGNMAFIGALGPAESVELHQGFCGR